VAEWLICMMLRLQVPGTNSSYRCSVLLHIFYPAVTVPRLGFASYFYCLQVDSFFSSKVYSPLFYVAASPFSAISSKWFNL